METENISEKIKECRTFRDIEILMHKTLPGWCVGFINKFSEDYPRFTENWHKTCEKAGVKPAQIMIVKKLDMKDKESPYNFFASCFSKAGFCVRRGSEFSSCPGCSDAIPTRELFSLIKKTDKNIPKLWSSYCLKCK